MCVCVYVYLPREQTQTVLDERCIVIIDMMRSPHGETMVNTINPESECLEKS